MSSKLQSNALWPDGVVQSMWNDNISAATHGSQDEAVAACQKMLQEGLDGHGEHFPLKVWVSPVKRPPSIPDQGSDSCVEVCDVHHMYQAGNKCVNQIIPRAAAMQVSHQVSGCEENRSPQHQDLENCLSDVRSFIGGQCQAPMDSIRKLVSALELALHAPATPVEQEYLQLLELKAWRARVLDAADRVHGTGAPRFKLSLNADGVASNTFPLAFNNRWVSFVFSEDDSHIGRIAAQYLTDQPVPADFASCGRDGLVSVLHGMRDAVFEARAAFAANLSTQAEDRSWLAGYGAAIDVLVAAGNETGSDSAAQAVVPAEISVVGTGMPVHAGNAKHC